MSMWIYRPSRQLGWLAVTGSDAAQFLQGQFSQDVRSLGPGGSRYGLWLDHKGRVTADGTILNVASAGSDVPYAIACRDPAAAAALRQRLESFIIADDVTIDDRSPEWAAWLAAGPGAESALRQAAGAMAPVFGGRRRGSELWEWVWAIPSSAFHAAADAVWAQGAGRRVTDEEWEQARILAGVPSIPEDIGSGDLPQEAELDVTAVSTDKGCYVGQEVMSRLKSRGRIRRRLQRVRGSGAAPDAQPAPLWREGRRVGELRSRFNDGAAGRWIGLALISADLKSGDRIGTASDAPANAELW